MFRVVIMGVALATAMLVSATGAGERAVEFKRHAGSMEIMVGGAPFASYVWADPEIPRPYFAHLKTPSGLQVTRNHPPVEGRDATDHATFHPGLWLAFGDISGADFWRNKAKVKHVEFVEEPTTDSSGGHFAVRSKYVAAGKTLCEELCRITILPKVSGTLLSWNSTFAAPDGCYFGDQEEMGLGVRVATPLTVKNGGRIVNSQGKVNEKETWGQTADWCDYQGKIDGRDLGVLLMSDPQNFRRPWFHSRDYGVLVANPFGQQAFTKGPLSKIALEPAKSLRLRFGVLVHEGATDNAAAYRDWLSGAAPRPSEK